MTDAELDAIRQYWRDIEQDKWTGITRAVVAEASRDIAALLAERAAFGEVVVAVAHGPVLNASGAYHCLYCGQPFEEGDPDDDQPGAITHTTACPVTKARALLAGVNQSAD